MKKISVALICDDNLDNVTRLILTEDQVKLLKWLVDNNWMDVCPLYDDATDVVDLTE